VDQLGPNALGEVLEPGQVADCCLGLLLPPGPAGEPEAGTILIIAPTALLHPRVPQPDGAAAHSARWRRHERPGGRCAASLLSFPTTTGLPASVDCRQARQDWRRQGREGEPSGRA
jgi:hypothetical protein